MVMTIPSEISASEFKAKCLQLLDQVAERQATIVVTKHGKPVARLVPISDVVPPLGGSGAGTAVFCGDLIDLDTSSDWEVLQS